MKKGFICIIKTLAFITLTKFIIMERSIRFLGPGFYEYVLAMKTQAYCFLGRVA
jgi:hypothetical protein